MFLTLLSNQLREKQLKEQKDRKEHLAKMGGKLSLLKSPIIPNATVQPVVESIC